VEGDDDDALPEHRDVSPAQGAASHEDAHKRRHRGIVHRVNEAKGFGFIRSKEAMAWFGCDVFLPPAERGDFKVGDKVTFLGHMNKMGRPGAYNLEAAEPAEGEEEEEEAEDTGAEVDPNLKQEWHHGPRFRGVLDRVDEAKGFGFIRSKKATLMFGCNVFLPPSERGDLKVGDEVTFFLQLTYDGMGSVKPRAHSVKPLDPAEGEEEEKESGAEAEQWQQQQRYRGEVNHFDEAKGFGFIRSKKAWACFGCDVFLPKDERGDFKPGDKVTFLLGLDLGGKHCFKPRAHSLEWLDPAEVEEEEEEEGETWAKELTEQDWEQMEQQHRVPGVVLSIDEARGFGFIKSKEAMAWFGYGSIYFPPGERGDFKVGDKVTFLVTYSALGKHAFKPRGYSLQHAPGPAEGEEQEEVEETGTEAHRAKAAPGSKQGKKRKKGQKADRQGQSQTAVGGAAEVKQEPTPALQPRPPRHPPAERRQSPQCPPPPPPPVPRGSMLEELEERKRLAVQNEDYDAAKALKVEIERCRIANERRRGGSSSQASPVNQGWQPGEGKPSNLGAPQTSAQQVTAPHPPPWPWRPPDGPGYGALPSGYDRYRLPPGGRGEYWGPSPWGHPQAWPTFAASPLRAAIARVFFGGSPSSRRLGRIGASSSCT